jgi:hypothetical protein
MFEAHRLFSVVPAGDVLTEVRLPGRGQLVDVSRSATRDTTHSSLIGRSEFNSSNN